MGTNNISNGHTVNQMLSFYGDLIYALKSKSSAYIIFTSIIPRLCDFHKSEEKVNLVNSELKKLCKRRNINFSNIYRSFMCNNKPDSSLYAPRDHLHLNFSGILVLKKVFVNIIKHLSI